MSNQTNNRNFNSSMKRAPPKCATCEKAGLTGKALEHFPRKTPDPNSEIVCPTIRGYKCGFCGESGHSKGFCKAFQSDQVRRDQEFQRREQEEERRKSDRKVQDEKLKQLTAKKLKSNIFTVFDDEEEEEAKIEQVKEQVKLKVECDFPSLSRNPVKVQETQQLYFAKIATSAAHLPIPKLKEPIEKTFEKTFDKTFEKTFEDEDYYYYSDNDEDYKEELNDVYSDELNEEYNDYNVNAKKVYGYDINEEYVQDVFPPIKAKGLQDAYLTQFNQCISSFPQPVADDSW